MKKIKKYIPLVAICFLVFIGIIIGFRKRSFSLNEKPKKLNKVSFNYQVQDDIGMMLYHRFHPEDDLLFGIIGSDHLKDYYAYYYKNNKLTSQDFPSFLKNMILIHDADYKTGEYNEDEHCYRMSYDNFRVIYDKLFGSNDLEFTFDENISPKVIQKENELCIEEQQVYDYKKTIDTYLVNIVRLDNKIIIYERVAFIKVTDQYIEFYNDYNMKNRIYKLDKKNVDMSFIHDSKIVSNVLLKYQNKFPLYQYTYVQGEDTYHLESISK